MAAIVVAAAGYLGDVAPYIPIANELADRGHKVTFLTPVGFHGLLGGERFRLATYPLDLSPAGMRDDPRHRRLMRHPLLGSPLLGRYLMEKGFTDDPAAVRAAVQATVTGADVVVTHPAHATVIQPVAEALGVPVVIGHLFPMLIPTAAWTPAMPSRPMRLGPLNKPMWRFASLIAHVTFRGGAVNRYRRELGLASLDMMRMPEVAARTVMLLPHAYAGDAPPDWPPMTWTGFSIWPGPSGQELTPELEEYLDAGEPPVLVTLGTSAALNAGEQFARIARDLDAVGLRSVLLVGGPENLGPVSSRPGVAEFAPLTALLPRCQAAVVSGALGGVAAALHAGVPMVVHPQIVDQHWHGRRVEDLGVGLRERRTGRVARAVLRVVSEPSFAARARTLAAEIADDPGAAGAADAVEEVLAAG